LEEVRPEFRLGNEEKRGLDLLEDPSKDERGDRWEKEDMVASGNCVLAASFPVEVMVVKTILRFGNSFFILLRRGIEQKTSPTDAAWIQMEPSRDRVSETHPLDQCLSEPF
jgi:hypothetical protein